MPSTNAPRAVRLAKIELRRQEVQSLNEVTKARLAAREALQPLPAPPLPPPLSKEESRILIRQQIREFLSNKVSVPKRGEVPRLQILMESLFRTALDRRSPQSVTAATALLDRGWGKPVAGDVDDPDQQKKGGLTVVYVDRMGLSADIPVVEDKGPKQLPPPEFIDADVVEEGPNGR